MKRIDIYYGGEHYSVGGRRLDDLRAEVEEGLAAGPYWLAVNDGEGEMRAAYTQHWAEAIDGQLGDQVDGLWHISSMTSEPMITLFERAASINSFPERPQFHRRVDDALMGEYVAGVAKQLGYGVR